METTKPNLRIQDSPIHPEVEKISGLIPVDVDAEALYREHLMSKSGAQSNAAVDAFTLSKRR